MRGKSCGHEKGKGECGHGGGHHQGGCSCGSGCDCGSSSGCSCGSQCSCGHHGGGWRRYTSKREKREKLESYMAELEEELQAVREKLEELA